MHTIIIRVSGGVVQDVEGVPPGVEVKVIDYDGDDDGDFETTDEHGERCNIATYDAEPVR
jgi:hypothetical protein